jgi:hypothetical protein
VCDFKTNLRNEWQARLPDYQRRCVCIWRSLPADFTLSPTDAKSAPLISVGGSASEIGTKFSDDERNV